MTMSLANGFVSVVFEMGLDKCIWDVNNRHVAPFMGVDDSGKQDGF